MKKKGVWLTIIAAVAAVAAAAIAAFIKRKSEVLSDQLDYDPEEYFEADEAEDEDYGEDGEPASCCCECEAEEGEPDCESCAFAAEEPEETDEEPKEE